MKRLKMSIIIGAILGVFCIIGANTRFPLLGNELFFIAMWYNRVIIGLVIGLADKIKLKPSIRGLLIGLIISTAFYISTNLADLNGFIAGIVYGVIIDYTASKYSK